MTKKEKQEYSELPFKYLPMSGWDYLGWSLAYATPIFGFFLVLINSFRSSNIARRNHARSYIVAFLVSAVVITVTLVIVFATMGDMIVEYIEALMEMMG